MDIIGYPVFGYIPLCQATSGPRDIGGIRAAFMDGMQVIGGPMWDFTEELTMVMDTADQVLSEVNGVAALSITTLLL